MLIGWSLGWSLCGWSLEWSLGWLLGGLFFTCDISSLISSAVAVEGEQSKGSVVEVLLGVLEHIVSDVSSTLIGEFMLTAGASEAWVFGGSGLVVRVGNVVVFRTAPAPKLLLF